MNRIEANFRSQRDQGRRGLMPYLTAGDPSLEATARLIEAIDACGAPVIEVGFPFSDPIADGPTIQASMMYALEHGVTIRGIFQTVASIREHVKAGLVAMISYSMVHRYGAERFVKDAKQAGIDGLIVPDLPLEEAEELGSTVRDAGLILSMLIAPATSDERAAQIASACSGFVYVVSRAGITGEQAQLPATLPDRLARLRRVTDLPLAVGFGISQAQQVRQVVEYADAAIVGSAVVRRMMEHRDAEPAQLAEKVETLIRDLSQGLPTQPSASAP